MPDVDPVTIDAIDRIINEKDPQAEWEDESMRNALMAVARGEKQVDIVEGRDFSESLLSQRWGDVKDYRDEMKQNQETGSGLFRDPVEEAAQELESWFEDMDEKYNFGFKDRIVRMLADEVRRNEVLPSPAALETKLNKMKSGVSGQDVDYLAGAYSDWLEKYRRQQGGMGGNHSPNQYGSGHQIGQQQAQQPNTPGGISIGGQPRGQQPPQQGQPQQQGGYQQQGQPQQQGGYQQQGQQGGQANERIEALEEEFEQLAGALGEIMEEVKGDSSSGDMVTVRVGDDTEVDMPFEKAMQRGLIGNDSSEEDDFLDKLAKMREAGLIDDGNEEAMAEHIGQAIESLGQHQAQAQQQMTQSFQSVLEEIREMNSSDDEELTVEKVDEIIEERMTKSEIEQMREEMSREINSLKSEVNQRRRASGEGQQDPETIETEREYDYKERQLEAMNQNLREIPNALSESVRDGLIPVISMMQGGAGEAWSPENAAGRGEPDFQPGGFDSEQQQQAEQQRRQQAEQQRRQQAQQQAQQPQQQARQGGQPQQQAAQPEAGGYPDPEEQPQQEESGGGVDEDEVNNIRDKIGLDGDDGQQEAGA